MKYSELQALWNERNDLIKENEEIRAAERVRLETFFENMTKAYKERGIDVSDFNKPKFPVGGVERLTQSECEFYSSEACKAIKVNLYKLEEISETVKECSPFGSDPILSCEFNVLNYALIIPFKKEYGLSAYLSSEPNELDITKWDVYLCLQSDDNQYLLSVANSSPNVNLYEVLFGRLKSTDYTMRAKNYERWQEFVLKYPKVYDAIWNAVKLTQIRRLNMQIHQSKSLKKAMESDVRIYKTKRYIEAMIEKLKQDTAEKIKEKTSRAVECEERIARLNEELQELENKENL